jgi:hypothetical protein
MYHLLWNAETPHFAHSVYVNISYDSQSKKKGKDIHVTDRGDP